ncbi:cytochrome P450 [Streptomyces sp. NPDC088921]|uniref:cytochrome P450 n=1 Tax=unclassified Streptomyces TaxID=2593676 RepID=UPI003444BDD5
MRTIEDLPGPKGLPIAGNLPALTRARAMSRVLERWCDEYGLTYRIRFGRTPMVVTADPELTSEMLRRRPEEFQRSHAIATVFDEAGVHGVFSAEGDEWRRLRKLATKSLSSAYIRQYFTVVTEVTRRLRETWAAGAGSPIDVLASMQAFTLDVTAWLAMGYDLDCLRSDGDGVQARVSELFPAFSKRVNAPFPYWRHLRLPRDRRLDASVQELGHIVRVRYEDAKERMSGGAEPANFLEALVKPQPGEPEPSYVDVLGNVLTMLVAGEDTTSGTLAWAVHYLSLHPEIQQKVAAEAEEVLGDSIPEPGVVSRLKYAEAVVNEAMRLMPVAPLTPLQTTRDLTVGDLELKRYTPILVLFTYGAMRDRERFGDTASFDPERWLGEQPPPALPFAPFGGGPRFCPGRNLAMIESTLVVSVLCKDFVIAPRNAGAVRERLGFTGYPEHLTVTVQPR